RLLPLARARQCPAVIPQSASIGTLAHAREGRSDMEEAMTGIGHNTAAGNQLKSIIERIERLEEEKKATSDDIRDVYAEAKSTGFDVKALRTIVRMRKQDASAR